MTFFICDDLPVNPDIDNCVSDHAICMTFDHKIITLNCMVKCRFNATRNFFNNGFGISDESIEEYQNRLVRLIHKLQTKITFNTDFICLQECPEAEEPLMFFLQQLDVLLPDFRAHSNNGNIVLSRKNVPTDIINISHLDTKSKLLAFLSNDTLYVNVHLSWKPKGEDSKEIEQLRNIIHNTVTNKIIFVGDFNREDHTIPDSMTHTIGIHEFVKLLCDGYSYDLYTTNKHTNFTLQDNILVFTTSDYYLNISKCFDDRRPIPT